MDATQPVIASVPLWRRVVFGRNPGVTLLRVVVLVAVSLVVFKFVLLPVRIEGGSMAPTYRDGGVNCINRLAYLFREPRRGDVVGVATTGVHIMYLKRVVGLPGERIAITNGLVYINGAPLPEPYVKERDGWHLPEAKLEADRYIVIGDNRGMDQRLHSWGAVTRGKIVGKVLW